MNSGVAEQFFPPDIRNRLAELVDLIPGPVIDDWHRPGTLQRLAEVDLLVTGWGCPRVDETVLAAAPRLRAIVHTAGSVRSIVGDACWSREIAVATAASANALPVAEYTLAMILLTNKRVLESANRLHRERSAYRDSPFSASLGNYRRTIGVLSASLIGRRLMELLRAHDFEILLYDPFVSTAEATHLGAELIGLHELFRRSDVVTIHTPLLPETVGLVGAHEIDAMRPGSILINTARGAILDHEALIAHVRDGRIRAVLDVTDPDPLPDSSELYDLDGVLLTPHIAGSKDGEFLRLTECALSEIRRWTQGLGFAHPLPQEVFSRTA
ncbi:hydroxyacid dehydrogenase [Streptomyces sp. NPDC056405]|uniref:hydroxyacid dehydrogenase n=1 Tax=Streptomyces sp. NPDC056405 TaxID=3345811 RepID=UPI0035DEAB45